MISIKFEAKGETLRELLAHMNMVELLIRLKENDEVITNCNNKGKTNTSNYTWSIENLKNQSWITGVAIKLNNSRGTIKSMLKGQHFELTNNMIAEGYMFNSNEITRGFILNNGKFLNRIEAAKHALENRQISDTKIKELTSQDLW